MVARRKRPFTGMEQSADRPVQQAQENLRVLQDKVTALENATSEDPESYNDTFLQSKVRALQRQINDLSRRIDEISPGDEAFIYDGPFAVTVASGGALLSVAAGSVIAGYQTINVSSTSATVPAGTGTA
jgi:hypothetical protein